MSSKKIKKLYTTPGSKVAFSSAPRIHKFLGGKTTLKKVKKALQDVESYTLHRNPAKPKTFNPYYVFKKRSCVQIDLIDISTISKENLNTNFLFVAIDVFTKKAWVYPSPRKDAKSMLTVFQKWFSDLKKKPIEIQADLGREWYNKLVQNFLSQQKVKLVPAYGWNKAGVVERLNRTLQLLIYTYLSENETLTYIDVLPKLVKTYNNRSHRTLKGFSPNEAEKKENQISIRDIHMQRYAKILKKKRQNKDLKVGDLVRVKTSASSISSSARGYAEKFHTELYSIIRISKRMPIPKYYLKSLKEGDIIEGSFYANELSKVSGKNFKIEKILKRKKVRNKKMVLVRYRDIGPQYDEWLLEKNVR